MAWTKKPPTKPGWYWVVYRKRSTSTRRLLKKRHIDVVFVDKRGDCLLVIHHELDSDIERLDYAIKYMDITHWRGPIPKPAPPPLD